MSEPITEPEKLADEIAEELALCLEVGITVEQVLRYLRYLRMAAGERRANAPAPSQFEPKQ
jgi:hypothetical protein